MVVTWWIVAFSRIIKDNTDYEHWVMVGYSFPSDESLVS